MKSPELIEEEDRYNATVAYDGMLEIKDGILRVKSLEEILNS